jgi:Arc/MetJ family transcription regulator
MMEMHMQKTTVMLDEELLQAAMNAIKARTKREAITAGLEALVQGANTRKLREELGTYDIELDLKGLDRLRNGE